MIQVTWDPQAQDYLDKLDNSTRDQILKKFAKDILSNPKRYIEHLEGATYGKIRVGDYRLFVDYIEFENQLIIRFMDHRGTAYKK